MTVLTLPLLRSGAGFLTAPYENQSVYTQEVVRVANRLENVAESGESLAFQELRDRDATRQLPGLSAETRNRLFELGELPADWDSYGALTPAWKTVARAGTMLVRGLETLGESATPTDIMPIADGAIQLEWRTSSGKLGLNACPDGEWSYLFVRGTGEGRSYEEDYGLSDDQALAVLIRAGQSLFA